MKALEGVKDWKGLCRWLGVQLGSSVYYVPHLSIKYDVEKFLQGERSYQPSWRAVIVALDKANEIHVADRIRHYGEPVQGECTFLYIVQI